MQCVGGDALRTQYQDQADMKASKGCQEQAGMEHLKILNVRTSQVCSQVDRMEGSHFLRRYISEVVAVITVCNDNVVTFHIDVAL